MQTFLPYASFAKSAACLDNRRLGKQRVEAMQILKILPSRKAIWLEASPCSFDVERTGDGVAAIPSRHHSQMEGAGISQQHSAATRGAVKLRWKVDPICRSIGL